MEVLEIAGHPGKLQVLFNGTQLDCVNDIDCPGVGLCALNQTWMLYPANGTCMCPTNFGLTGLECTEYCGQGIALFVIYIVTGLIAIITTVISFNLVIRLLWYREHRACNAIILALMLTGFGSLFFIVGCILGLLVSVGFPVINEIVYINQRYVRRTPISFIYAANIFFLLGECVSITAVVTLPVSWIDILRQSSRLREGRSRRIAIFTAMFVIVMLLAVLPIYVLSISDPARAQQLELAKQLIWAAIFVPILVINIVAFVYVTRSRYKLRTQLNGSRQDVALETMLKRIQITSILFFLSSLLVLSLLSFLYSSSFRGYYTDPRCYADAIFILVRSAAVATLFNSAIVIWFVMPNAQMVISQILVAQSRLKEQQRLT